MHIYLVKLATCTNSFATKHVSYTKRNNITIIIARVRLPVVYRRFIMQILRISNENYIFTMEQRGIISNAGNRDDDEINFVNRLKDKKKK